MVVVVAVLITLVVGETSSIPITIISLVLALTVMIASGDVMSGSTILPCCAIRVLSIVWLSLVACRKVLPDDEDKGHEKIAEEEG